MTGKVSLAVGVVLVASLTTNVYLASRTWRAEARAKRVEARSIEPIHQRVLLNDIDLLDLKAAGLTDPVNQIRSDLGSHPELIPVQGVFGGTMGFYDRDGIVLLPGGYVYAPADDGHIVAHTVLRYDVKPGGKIEWKLLDSRAGE